MAISLRVSESFIGESNTSRYFGLFSASEIRHGRIV